MTTAKPSSTDLINTDLVGPSTLGPTVPTFQSDAAPVARASTPNHFPCAAEPQCKPRATPGRKRLASEAAHANLLGLIVKVVHRTASPWIGTPAALLALLRYATGQEDVVTFDIAQLSPEALGHALNRRRSDLERRGVLLTRSRGPAPTRDRFIHLKLADGTTVLRTETEAPGAAR